MSEQVVEVLAAHRYVPCAEHTPTVNAWWAQCEGCEWRGPRRSHRNADENDHRAHLAAALSPLIAERERAAAELAWDFGYACGLGDYGKSDNETCAANPYRAERGQA